MSEPLIQKFDPVYLSHQIRQVEQQAAALSLSPGLMERAGLAAAKLAQSLLRDQQMAVLVVAGPGNNGGDALVAARYLKQGWFKVSVVFAGERDKLPADAKHALQQWLDAGGELLDAIPEHGKWNLIIDGLFGIGLARDLEGVYLKLVKQINQMQLPVLALDIPSGLDSDTGQPFRAAVRATHTLTFLALKPGLLTAYGADYCGEIHLDTLGVDPALLPQTKGHLLNRNGVADTLKPRPHNSHKGMLGSAGILGGAASMCGAALLAGRAALKLGAGRVYAGLLDENAPALDMQQPELMLRTPEQLFELDHLSCLVVGPGLGQSDAALHHLQRALATGLPLVLDADALNLIGAHATLASALKDRKGGAVLTPHPAEAARLLDCGTHDVQQDRIGSALVLASRFNSMVVLKGAGSICALPDESWYINPTGNPGLSSAGMGDVLSGIIGALLAQRVSLEKAVLLGVYLHGAAADQLVAEGIGPVGLTASEVIDKARDLLNQWV